jgi:hypothetical protein
MRLFFGSIFVMFLASCSVLDYPLRAFGVSISKFKTEHVEKFSKIFKMSKKDCFEKSLNVIKNLEGRVTHKNFRIGYVVAFGFAKSFSYCLDSTEVAVFISEVDKYSVKVELVSESRLLGSEMSVKFFEMLES